MLVCKDMGKQRDMRSCYWARWMCGRQTIPFQENEEEGCLKKKKKKKEKIQTNKKADGEAKREHKLLRKLRILQVPVVSNAAGNRGGGERGSCRRWAY